MGSFILIAGISMSNKMHLNNALKEYAEKTEDALALHSSVFSLFKSTARATLNA